MKKIILLFILLFFVFSAGTVFAITPQERQNLILQITQQISNLQQQLAQMISQQAGPANWCYNFSKNIKPGDKGVMVYNLQIALQKEGFAIASGELYDQFFGNSTARAVSSFQMKYYSEILAPAKLSQGTGNVGTATRIKLNKIYACVSTAQTSCSANCVIQPSGTYAVDCNGKTTKCTAGQICQQVFKDVNQYQGQTVQTARILTGAKCQTCVSACANRQCGADDGCGKPCQTGICSSGYICKAGQCIDPNACLATCVTQDDEVYAVDCQGKTTKCASGKTCEKTYKTTYQYLGSEVKTIQTLTGSKCK